MTEQQTAAPAQLSDLHVPVLAQTVDALLTPALSTDGAVLIDATLGIAGHSLVMFARHPGLRVIGIDRDPEANTLARQRLAAAGFADRIQIVNAVYDEIGDVAATYAPDGVQAVLFDLGVSSLQLDRADRGFAYAVDAPLDMRMNPADTLTASDILNTYPRVELARVLRMYGQERFAPKIAAAICRARTRQPFVTSGPLVELIRAAIPAAARRHGGHPAKRTFQALRIEVNDELGALRRAIPAALDALAVGGRIVVLSYHSLEDRIVKHALAERVSSPLPPDLPVTAQADNPEFRLLFRGSHAPSEAEILDNPRAASARLRAAERLREAA